MIEVMRETASTLWGAGTIAALCVIGNSVQAQYYSANIVGYANISIYAGNNFVANQFDNGSGNTLNSIYSLNIPEGATFTKWDSATCQYLPVSTYDTSSGWSINYQLNFGEGGLFNAPTTFTNTYYGSVWSGFSAGSSLTPPLIASKGVFLLSCYIPISPADFYDVVGRNPEEGDTVDILNGLTQTEIITTYHDGSWSNGDPDLAIGESAIYQLGGGGAADFLVQPVPEPSTIGLAGFGLMTLVGRRLIRNRSQS